MCCMTCRNAPPEQVCKVCRSLNGCPMECRAAFIYDERTSSGYKVHRLIAQYDVGYYKKTNKRGFPLIIPESLQKLVDLRIRQRQELLAKR